MPRFVSKVDHVYFEKRYKAGKEFDCDEEDIPILKALGRIDANQPVTITKNMVAGNTPTYQTKTMAFDSKKPGPKPKMKAA